MGDFNVKGSNIFQIFSATYKVCKQYVCSNPTTIL